MRRSRLTDKAIPDDSGEVPPAGNQPLNPHTMARTKVLHSAIALGLLAVLGAFCVRLYGQTTTTASPPNNIVARAQQFVRTIHPDLSRLAEMRVTIDHPFGVPWDHTVGACDLWVGDKPFGSHHPQFGPAKTLFTGKIIFRRDGAVVQFFGYKESTRLKEEELREQVKRRRDWSDQNVIDALGKAGALFGPDKKEAFKANLRLQALELFVSDLHVTDLEFELRDKHEGQDGKPEYSAQLQWWVHADARSKTGSPIHYAFTFEPFEGRLSGVFTSD